MVGAGLGEPPAEMLDSMEKSPNFDFFFRHYVVGLGRYELNVAAGFMSHPADFGNRLQRS